MTTIQKSVKNLPFGNSNLEQNKTPFRVFVISGGRGSVTWSGSRLEQLAPIKVQAALLTEKLTEKQWEVLNAKRIELIDKDLDQTISPDEKRQLDRLEALASEYVRRVAPLPFDALDAMEAELEKRGL